MYNTIVPGLVETSLPDHLGGFNSSLRSLTLDHLSQHVKPGHRVISEYIFSDEVKKNYPTLHLCYGDKLWRDGNSVESFKDYKEHPNLEFQNFVCSFNGSEHLGRKFLVAILERFGFFDPTYCSKNIIFSSEKLDGHISDYAPANRARFYRKFFIGSNSESFFQTLHTFNYARFDHSNNIYNLESKLTKSFLHIVSETMSTSYYPFVTEKFLYSIVTRGLFLAYAQPGWHDYVEKYYGFKKYTNLFDYRFDSIQDPMERLVELMSMISKFSKLSSDDWRDLYLLEQDTVEYNYDHYHSGNYLKYFNDGNS